MRLPILCCKTLLREVKAQTSSLISRIPVIGFEGKNDHFKPLIEELQKIEAILKPVSPLSIKRYKDILFTQEKKDDDIDALAIADYLHARSQQVRELKVLNPKISAIKELSRLHRDYAKQFNRYTNKLIQGLSEYFPEYISKKFFSKVTCKSSLELLANYPGPSEIKTLSLSSLTQFLTKHSRGHLKEKKAEEILCLINSLSGFSFDASFLGLKTSTLASTLLVLTEQITKLEKKIKEELKDIPETNILKSIPGVGNITTARFLGEIGSVDNFKDDDSMALYVGLGLLKDESGKKKVMKKTSRFNRHAKYAIMQMASCSIRHNPDSFTFYQRKIKEGKGHWQAVKCLARNMLRVIFVMLKNKTMYQPDFKNQEVKLANAA